MLRGAVPVSLRIAKSSVDGRPDRITFNISQQVGP